MHLPADDLCPIDRLTPYANNARTHSRKQIGQIAESIRRFGFTNPALVADDGTIIAGHGRVEAARMIGIEAVTVSATSRQAATNNNASSGSSTTFITSSG